MPNSGFTVELLQSDDTELLSRVLFDAMPNPELLRAIINCEETVAYTATIGRKLVGAAVVRWSDTTEIELIAVMDRIRGRRYGTAIMNTLINEADNRHVKKILVGTASYAVGNIIFYQKCGFRLSSVRRDHFGPHKPPIISRGIQLRDMIVFELELPTRK